ncbi:PPE FAMILY domain protein [Mycobacterium ulcerans str. Harvey]|uniref:PPE FAMILY domain protein n=1 Tax=Mycobacterium ulcerans str. Harvey TaxID=1299332 RepID=A0ABN0QVJ2_MYCUL|nr:PPE FAMILY domain protein [Mycobacterium ulcerans str. Harvey]
MAVASCAHISAYSASVAAIAGVLMPEIGSHQRQQLHRFAATTLGGTVMANAASNAAAAAAA